MHVCTQYIRTPWVVSLMIAHLIHVFMCQFNNCAFDFIAHKFCAWECALAVESGSKNPFVHHMSCDDALNMVNR